MKKTDKMTVKCFLYNKNTTYCRGNFPIIAEPCLVFS